MDTARVADRHRRIVPPQSPKTAGAAHERATARALVVFARMLRRYHRHRVHGMGHLRAAVDSGRPVILVGNHVMDVADPMMLVAAIERELGHPIAAIGHRIVFFELPVIRVLGRMSGIIPSRDSSLAEKTLRRDGLLLLYPGAGQEAALRSYRREPYTLKWYGRLGFVELALRTGAVILFVAGVGIDEMYYQTDWGIPQSLIHLIADGYLEEYRGARIQLGAAGIHIVPAILPLPVRVTHTISAPLALDDTVDPCDRPKLEKAQVELWAQCQRLLDAAVSLRERDSDWLDRALRAGMRELQRIGL